MSKRILITDEIQDVQSQDFLNLGSSPATPESGHGLLYAKNDGKIYFKNDSGLEKALGEADLSGYQQTSEKGAANGYASLDAGGLVPIAQMPPAVMERIYVVADQTARYALTTAQVQNGDVVKQTDTGMMYFVKDDTNLGNSSGYEIFSAGTAASVPWSGITSVDTQVADLAALSYSGNANKLLAVKATEDGMEFITAPASGANAALSNLASVAINENLVFDKASPIVQSKDQTGSTASENVVVKSGTTVNGNSGSVELSSGIPSGSGSRGDVAIEGGYVYIGSTATDIEMVSAGGVLVDSTEVIGKAASLTVKTQNQTGATPSNALTISSGQSVNGNSGNVTVEAGVVSGSGTRGTVTLNGSSVAVSAPSLTIPNSSGYAAPTKAINDGMLRKTAGGWYKMTVNYSYFTAAATSETKTLVGLYGLGNTAKLVDAVFVKPVTAFAGSGISAATVEIGANTSGTTALTDPYSVMTVGNSNWQTSQSMLLSTSSVDNNITMTLRTTGGNISALTAGVVDVYMKFSDLTSLPADLTL